MSRFERAITYAVGAALFAVGLVTLEFIANIDGNQMAAVVAASALMLSGAFTTAQAMRP